MSKQVTIDRGKTLGERYELFEEIGEGSFGRVFRAHQLDVGRDVAIKILPPDMSAMDDVVERFRREARLASRLRHPNTITIHEYGRHEDLFFIAMEYLRGEDLADRLATKRTLELSTALHITRQTLHSLAEAHKMGIVHRDLKPENIFLTELAGDTDFVKILDFGIAKIATHHPQAATEEGRSLTIQGSTVGTPIYMSPEQAAGEDVDAASDLYALAVILYEMVNGSPPFMRDRPVRTMRAHLFDPVPPFSKTSLRDTVFDSIVRKALAKDPSDRYASAEEFLDALSRPDLESLLSDTRERPGAHSDTTEDSVPFESVSDRIPADKAPPPAGFSADDASTTSSIITVLDEPSENDVIVLTKKKQRSSADDADNQESDELSSGVSSSDYSPDSSRESSPSPDVLDPATEEMDSGTPDSSGHRADWKWSDDITAADASGSQILTDYEPTTSRTKAIGLATAIIIVAFLGLVFAMGWVP